ncbi:unnamed protein product [Clavelina lepadiformis]|uniref:BTB domain-containing protein n=1 Tax=Clavelina lepadiformis TaxID=159417 RepID=A0ABP0FWR4_CLALP
MLSDKFKTLCDEITIEGIVFKRYQGKRLQNHISRKQLNGNFNDVIIKVEDESFLANRMVLSTFSEYFEIMFDIEMKEKQKNEVEIHNVTANTMKLIIEFIYTGQIEINKNNVCELHSASNMMQVNAVTKCCLRFLAKAISPTTCLTISYLADFYGYEHLEDQAIDFIEKNIDGIIVTKHFRNLSKDDILPLFKKTKSRISEIALYKAIVNWTYFELEKRRGHFQSLFQAVELTTFSLSYLEKTVSQETLVRENCECLKALVDSILKVASIDLIRAKGSRILSVGGTETSKEVIEIFNICSDEFKIFPNLDIAHSALSAVVIGNNIYVIGGGVPNELGMLASNNFVSCLNLNKEDLEWKEVKHMEEKRWVTGTAVLGGEIYATGGDDDNIDFRFYFPAFHRWLALSPMEEIRHGNVLVACEGFLYAIGGYNNGLHLKTVERYKPSADEWNHVASMATPRMCFASVTIGDFIYVIGGESERGTTEKSVEKYDVAANKWTRVKDMNYERHSHSACVMYGNIYVVGGLGADEKSSTTIECYDPDDDKWTIVGETSKKLFNHSVVVI